MRKNARFTSRASRFSANWRISGASLPRLDILADVESFLGDYASTRSFYEESLATFQQIGDRQGTTRVLVSLGRPALRNQITARRGPSTRRALHAGATPAATGGRPAPGRTAPPDHRRVRRRAGSRPSRAGAGPSSPSTATPARPSPPRTPTRRMSRIPPGRHQAGAQVACQSDEPRHPPHQQRLRDDLARFLHHRGVDGAGGGRGEPTHAPPPTGHGSPGGIDACTSRPPVHPAAQPVPCPPSPPRYVTATLPRVPAFG